MSKPGVEIEIFNTKTSDVEYIRKIAETFNDNYTVERFYNHKNYAYVIGYLNKFPVWLSVLQSRKEWSEDVVGINRRVFTTYKDFSGISTNSLGLFGEQSTILQINFAKKLNFKTFFTSSERRSFIRSSLSKKERLDSLTNLDWKMTYNRYQVAPNSWQYCIWAGDKELAFEKEN
jgi:hypothetical protein